MSFFNRGPIIWLIRKICWENMRSGLGHMGIAFGVGLGLVLWHRSRLCQMYQTLIRGQNWTNTFNCSRLDKMNKWWGVGSSMQMTGSPWGKISWATVIFKDHTPPPPLLSTTSPPYLSCTSTYLAISLADGPGFYHPSLLPSIFISAKSLHYITPI